MKPPPFSYSSPSDLESALSLLEQSKGKAALLAGGQSLVPLLNQRKLRFEQIIDLGKIQSLRGISVSSSSLQIEAMTPQRELESDQQVLLHFPEFAQFLPKLGFPATRNRGTVGGSLAFADPAAELPALALALNGEIKVASRKRGERILAMEDFLSGPFKTTLSADEMVTALILPLREAVPSSYLREVNVRATGRAVAGILAFADGDDSLRATLFGWSDRPRQITLKTGGNTANNYCDHLAKVVDESAWQSDAHGNAGYRKHLFAKLLEEASESLFPKGCTST